MKKQYFILTIENWSGYKLSVSMEEDFFSKSSARTEFEYLIANVDSDEDIVYLLLDNKGNTLASATSKSAEVIEVLS